MFILQKKIKKFKKESFSSLKPEKLEIYYRIVISNSNGYKSKAVRQLFPNKSKFQKIDNGPPFYWTKSLKQCLRR